MSDNETVSKITTTITEEAKKEAEWQKTLVRMGLAVPDVSQVRDSDILYLLDQWPFLQLAESGGHVEPFKEPKILTLKSGWNAIYHGDSLATSPGKYIFRGGYFQWTDNDDDEGDGGIVNPKHGTIYKQAFDSACELIQLVKEYDWRGAQIVDGHPSMQRAAWVEACRIGVRLDGYQPDMQAEKQRRRIVSTSMEEMHQVLKGL